MPGQLAPKYFEINSCVEPEGLQLYPHPTHCDQFYKCANGTLTLETCENGLLFDNGEGAVHNHCNYHWGVQCYDRVYERTFTDFLNTGFNPIFPIKRIFRRMQMKNGFWNRFSKPAANLLLLVT